MWQPEYMKLPIKAHPLRNHWTVYPMPQVHNGYIYICIDKGMCGLPQVVTLHGIFSKRDWPNMATGPPSTHLDCGSITHDPSGSASVLMALASSTPTMRMHNISSTLSNSTMWSPLTGRAPCTVAWLWNGTTKTTVLTFSCPNISRMPSTHSTIPNQSGPLTVFPNSIQHSTHQQTHSRHIQSSNCPTMQTSPTRHRQVLVLWLSSRLNHSPHDQWPQLTTIQGHHQHHQRVQLHAGLPSHPSSGHFRYHASPMQLHIYSDASYLIAPEAKSWAGEHSGSAMKVTTKTSHTTDQRIPQSRSWIMSLLLQLRLKWEPFTWMPRKLSPLEWPSKNWATPNNKHP